MPSLSSELPLIVPADFAGPLTGRGRAVARVGPILGAATVIAGSAALGPFPVLPEWFLAGAVVWLAVSTFLALAPWTSLPPLGQVLPPIASIVAVGLMRHGFGGAESGLSPLVLIPILWLGLFGARWQLVAGFVAMLAVFITPIVLIGGAEYPPAEWRRVLILASAGGFVGFAIQGLVIEVRRRGARAARQASELAEQVAVTEAVVETADDAVISFDETGRMTAFNAAAAEMLGWGDRSPAGLDLFDTLVAPPDRRRLRDGFQRLLAGLDTEEARTGRPGRARQPRFETELLRANGTYLPVEATVGAAGLSGQRRVHAFARDISTRRAAEQAVRGHLDDLARLLSVARDLGRPASATDGRQAICDAARDLAGADMALFFEARPQEGLLVSTGASGDGNVPNRVALNARRSMTADVFASGLPTFVGDLLADERVDRATAARMHVRAAYWQPVLRDGAPIGILVIYWRTPQEGVSERVRSLLELFATQAAVVVERADLMGRLESLARTDPLTGLANRRALEEALVRELAAAERSRQTLSVVMVDLDHFKRFNDAHGHQAGDALLVEIGRAWQTELRPSDTLARFGGEEFLVVLPVCDTERAITIADRLRALVPGDETASAGVATWDSVETMSDLIARADAALYEAKRRGRDRTETAPGPARAPDDRRTPDEAYLRRRKSLRIAG